MTDARTTKGKFHRAQLERYARQEARRADRVQVDQPITLRINLGIALVALVTSGIISFNGITSIAPLIGLSLDWQRYMVFGFIEGLIAYFTLNYLIRSSRVDEQTNEREKATSDFWGLIVFSGVAILGNAYHSFTFHHWDFSSSDTYAGVALSVMAPIAIIWITKSSSNTLFARAIRMDEK